MGLLDYLVTQQTWIFTLWLIPISISYDLYLWLSLRWNYLTAGKKTHLRHQEKVRDVQRQVDEYNKSGCNQPMCTSRPSYESISMQRLLYKDRMYNIKIDMADIILIDTENKFIRVEPRVTIGKLNDFLGARGWMLPVVPELDDLTIGGLVMGGGIESTSHKYGLFNYICKQYEMILADGSVVWCSPTENKELFAVQPLSYGTLGFLTCVDIDIIPYKPYMKLTYHNVQSLDAVVNKFTEATNDPEVDSVEGIMYTLNSGVIMSGKFVDRVPSNANYNPIGRWYKPWFFKHVETFMDEAVQKRGNVEYIPTNDFIHRHNKSYFWLMNGVCHFANNVLFRYLLGWSMPPRFGLLKRMKQALLPDEANVNSVLQDYIMKLEDLKESLVVFDEAMKVYPVWLCPTRHMVQPGLEEYYPYNNGEVHVDVGIYGWSPIPGFDVDETQKRMERFCIDHEAFAALYAETKMTFEEFNEMFSVTMGLYEKVRKDLKCEKAFPHVYQKISNQGRKSGY